MDPLPDASFGKKGFSLFPIDEQASPQGLPGNS